MAKRKQPKYGPLTTRLFALADEFRKLKPKRAVIVHLYAGKPGSITVTRKPGSIHHQVHRSKSGKWKRLVAFRIDNGP